jgi:hypothetical protein
MLERISRRFPVKVSGARRVPTPTSQTHDRRRAVGRRSHTHRRRSGQISAQHEHALAAYALSGGPRLIMRSALGGDPPVPLDSNPPPPRSVHSA